MNNPARCSVCNEADHKGNHCPELTKELQPGFYTPAGGMPQGGGDDDDEHLRKAILSPLFAIFIKNNTRCDSNIQRSQNAILANADHRSLKCL
jgi:hypothetical protein